MLVSPSALADGWRIKRYTTRPSCNSAEWRHVDKPEARGKIGLDSALASQAVNGPADLVPVPSRPNVSGSTTEAKFQIQRRQGGFNVRLPSLPLQLSKLSIYLVGTSVALNFSIRCTLRAIRALHPPSTIFVCFLLLIPPYSYPLL